MPILTLARNTIPDKIDAKHSYELKLANNKPWFTPAIVLASYDRLKKKVGRANLETKGKFQKVRELRATALFLLGIYQRDNKEYWLQPVLNEQTPDVRAFCYDRDSDGTIEEVIQEVEVVTYKSFEERSLVRFIKDSKLIKNSYPYYYVILCELKKDFILPSPNKLNNSFQKISPKQHIAFIGKINPHAPIYRALKVYPKIDLCEDFNAITLALRLDRIIKSERRHHTMLLKLEPKTKEFKLRSSSQMHHPFSDVLEKELCV